MTIAKRRDGTRHSWIIGEVDLKKFDKVSFRQIESLNPVQRKGSSAKTGNLKVC